MKTLSVAISEKQWVQGGGVLSSPNVACIGMALCLVAEAENRASWDESVFRLSRIVTRLWPERVDAGLPPMERIVVFNDHRDTTYTDVQKAAREYDLEVDLHA